MVRRSTDVKFPPHADDPLPGLAAAFALFISLNAALSLKELGTEEEEIRQAVRAANPSFGGSAARTARGLAVLSRYAARGTEDMVFEFPAQSCGMPDAIPAILRAGGLAVVRQGLEHKSPMVSDAAVRALDALLFKRHVANEAIKDPQLIAAFATALEATVRDAAGSWCMDCGSPGPRAYHALSAAERLLGASHAPRNLSPDSQKRLGLALRSAAAEVARAAKRVVEGGPPPTGHDERGFMLGAEMLARVCRAATSHRDETLTMNAVVPVLEPLLVATSLGAAPGNTDIVETVYVTDCVVLDAATIKGVTMSKFWTPVVAEAESAMRKDMVSKLGVRGRQWVNWLLLDAFDALETPVNAFFYGLVWGAGRTMFALRGVTGPTPEWRRGVVLRFAGRAALASATLAALWTVSDSVLPSRLFLESRLAQGAVIVLESLAEVAAIVTAVRFAPYSLIPAVAALAREGYDDFGDDDVIVGSMTPPGGDGRGGGGGGGDDDGEWA